MSHPAERPLVTFFVMSYNQEAYVREAIEGAFAQTYEPLEIILSDDASTDATYRLMEELAATYEGPHRVVLNRNPENLGIMAHVNRIMELATGALIVLGAGDDISEPHRVARLAEAWLAGGGRTTSVHSSVMKIDAAGAPVGLRRPPPPSFDHATPAGIVQFNRNCIGATQAWDRRVFETFGPLVPRDSVEDGPIFFRAALLGQIAYLDEPLVRYRIGGLSAPVHDRPGRRYLYGDRVSSRRWRLANYHAFVEDLAKVDVPGKEALVQDCRRKILECEFELGLVAKSRLQRVATLPVSVRLSLGTGKARFVLETLKYIFDRPYMLYYDLRYYR